MSTTSVLSKNLNKSKGSNNNNPNFTNRTNLKAKTAKSTFALPHTEKQPIANIKINLKDLIKENVIEKYYDHNLQDNNMGNISTIAKNKSNVSPNLNTFQDCIDKFTFTDKSNIKKSYIMNNPKGDSETGNLYFLNLANHEQNGISINNRYKFDAEEANSLSQKEHEENDDENEEIRMKKPQTQDVKLSNKVVYKIDLTESEMPNFNNININIDNEEPQKLRKLL